ncbi:MAG: hypothetical protein PVJ76_12140 [Gemmatimonadota bacterium]
MRPILYPQLGKRRIQIDLARVGSVEDAEQALANGVDRESQIDLAPGGDDAVPGGQGRLISNPIYGNL